MRRALLAAALAAGAPGGEAENLAFVEVRASKEEVYAGEPIHLSLRFGVEVRLLSEGVVPVSMRRLDVPVLVEAPWFDGLPGAPAAAGPAQDQPGASFALNDGVARALRDGEAGRDGRTYRVLEVERTLWPGAPGEFEVPETVLRAAYATRFEEDALGGRVPLDRNPIEVRAPALRVRVLPLPAEGRTAGFTGAVGRFTVRAECAVREIPTGGSAKLLLRFEGEGNLGSFDPPRLDGLEGFHVRGLVEERAPGTRTITYDLAPLGPAVREIPPIPFPYVDPGPPAGYRLARTDPIPLRVRP
ncbi:MAG: hypothetical protein L0323_03400, partial [Planctomycetes bacterium]|nr:hypothetical protein [Planctomycetota bacterium]